MALLCRRVRVPPRAFLPLLRTHVRGISVRETDGNNLSVTLSHERFDELLAREAIATALTASPTDITIPQLLSHGMPHGDVPQNAVVLSAAQFLYHELPVRFASNLVRLDKVLSDLRQNGVKSHELEIVRDSIMQSFRKMRLMEMPRNMRQEAELAEAISGFLQQHARHSLMVGRGVYKIGKANKGFLDPIQDFLDLFFRNRMGSGMLMEHHMGLREKPRRPGYVGAIALELSMRDVVNAAVADAESLFQTQYAMCPKVDVIGQDVRFPYIPSHLHYIVFELVKNAMGATIRRHGHDPELPKIEIVLGGKDAKSPYTFVGLEIRDAGGGIPLAKMDDVWRYAYTTNKYSGEDDEAESPQDMEGTRIAGYGVGLPLARMYARYFGGDVLLRSVPQYGTSATVLLATSKASYILHEAQKGAEARAVAVEDDL